MRLCFICLSLILIFVSGCSMTKPNNSSPILQDTLDNNAIMISDWLELNPRSNQAMLQYWLYKHEIKDNETFLRGFDYSQSRETFVNNMQIPVLIDIGLLDKKGYEMHTNIMVIKTSQSEEIEASIRSVDNGSIRAMEYIEDATGYKVTLDDYDKKIALKTALLEKLQFSEDRFEHVYFSKKSGPSSFIYLENKVSVIFKRAPSRKDLLDFFFELKAMTSFTDSEDPCFMVIEPTNNSSALYLAYRANKLEIVDIADVQIVANVKRNN